MLFRVMRKSAWIAIAISASLLAATAVWTARLGLVPTPAATAVSAGPAAATPPSETELIQVREQLDRERDARLALELQVSELREQLGALEGSNSATAGYDAASAGEAPPEEVAALQEATAAPASPVDPGAANAASAPNSFDAQALARLGLPEHEIERLREAWDAKEMEVLYLRDLARREGWARKPRFAHQSHLIEQRLRQQLGDEDYDRALFASGRENRPRIERVLTGSPAEAVGLQQGDVVVSYNGQRMFTPQDLPRAVVHTPPGTVVTLDILREGQPERLRVGAGPLGIHLGATRLPPSP